MKYEFVIKKIIERFWKEKKQENSFEMHPSELGSTGGVIKAIAHLPNQPSNLANSECDRKRDENFERKTHEDLFENFMEINSSINSATMKRYTNILQFLFNKIKLK